MTLEDKLDEELKRQVLESGYTEKEYEQYENEPRILEKMAEKINPDNFFYEDAKGRIHWNQERVFKELSKKYRFVKILGDKALYYYCEGIWKENGEEVITMFLSEHLPEKFRSYYIGETATYIRGRCLVNGGFDENKNLICLENGVLDIEKRELMEWSPEYHLTVKLPIKYDPNAMCFNIEKFLSEIVSKDDVENVKEMFGYCLYRDMPIQRSFMLVGDGANGKSTLIKLFKAFLGKDNVVSISLQDLNRQRFAASCLINKLANLYSDLPAYALKDTGFFKISTGGDMISAEKKFGGRINFMNYAKYVFSCNKVPDVEDDTGAYFRRWVIINFPNKFEGTSDVKDLILSLTTEEELSGLLNAALNALQRLLENGDFFSTKTTEETRDDYKRKANSVWAFAEDCLLSDPEGVLTKEETYSVYVEYCKKHNYPIKTNNVFARELKKEVSPLAEGLETRGGRRVTVWRGIKTNDENSNVNLDKFVEDDIDARDIHT